MTDRRDDKEPVDAFGQDGPMGRELAFRLLASHALVDSAFYELLRTDPQAAAASINLYLDADDAEVIKHQVKWAQIGDCAGVVRGALPPAFANSSW